MKRGKDEEENGQGGRGVPRAHTGRLTENAVDLQALFQPVDTQLIADGKTVQEMSGECHGVNGTMDSVDPACDKHSHDLSDGKSTDSHI